jgi:aldehyde:ferredoxin oxidoreductase
MIYGSKKSVDPKFPYEYKAQTTIQVQHESVLKDSLLLCDQMMPLYYSSKYENGYYRVETSEYGTIGGKSLEYYLYVSVTGNDISESEFLKCAERVFNLERAIQIRNYDRRKKDDINIIPYFEKPELFPGPSGKAESLDRSKFLKLVDEYYELRGWDKETGIPTRAKLESLDLKDVADELEYLQ